MSAVNTAGPLLLSPLADVAEIKHAVTFLLQPEQMTELRLLGPGKEVRHGFFDNHLLLVEAAEQWSGRVDGCYVIPNPVDPALLTRASNCVISCKKGSAASDTDILRRTRIFLDFDPVRRAGTSATEGEHEAAVARAQEVFDYLADLGWPESGYADSGNGCHLHHVIDLPNDNDSRDLIRRVLRALALQFTDNAVILDEATYNAARLCKLYGTLAMKGEPTAERPHRMAQLEPFDEDKKFEAVTREMLEAAAARMPATPKPSRPTGQRLDVASWLREHDLAVDRETEWNGGRKYILASCPLNPEHRRTAFVIQFPNGALAAGCLHKSCAGLSWQTLRDMYEPKRVTTPESLDFTDDALALKFTETYGATLRFSAGSWRRWTGKVFESDDLHFSSECAREICRQAAEVSKKRTIASARTVTGVLKLATSDSQTAVSAAAWDADPWLFNVANGVVDLRTGELLPHDPRHLMTKIASCELAPPRTPKPLWDNFLNRVLPAKELQDHLQKFCGYSATAITTDQFFVFAHGTGANGKGVFVSTITGILGSYAGNLPISTFMATALPQHPCDVASTQGKRLVTASEPEQDRRWNESLLKALTGEDATSARFMRENLSTFTPTAKIFIMGNHRPHLRSTGEEIRRRMHLIPFTTTIPIEERDPQLKAKLKAEWPAILRWMVDGCLLWQRDGLRPPAAVTDAVTDYMTDEDRVGRWISDCCVTTSTTDLKVAPGYFSSTAELFSSWKQWADGSGEWSGSINGFSQSLESTGPEHGVRKGNLTKARGFRGIRLLSWQERQDRKRENRGDDAGEKGGAE
jgi:putative DNA primase/helicase